MMLIFLPMGLHAPWRTPGAGSYASGWGDLSGEGGMLGWCRRLARPKRCAAAGKLAAVLHGGGRLSMPAAGCAAAR